MSAGRPGIDAPGVGTGLVVRRPDGRVLLYRRMRPPEAGHWSIPGGKVDLMERTEEAARREAVEETGLAIGTVAFLCLSEQMGGPDRQHWVSVIYRALAWSGEPRLMEPEALSDFGWFDPADPPRPLSAFAADALRALGVG